MEPALEVVRVRLSMRPAPGMLRFRDLTLVAGPHGWGECSPYPGFSCDELLCFEAARQAATRPFPKAVRDHVPVNALVPAIEPKAAAAVAAAARAEGYQCVKVKVGDEASLERVAAVRDAIGPRVALRVDANGAWQDEEALEALSRLSAYDLELAEQPVASLDGLAWLRRRVAVPIAADEAIRSIEDAKRLRRLGAADAIVIKQQPLGGIDRSLEVIDAARLPVIVTSMFESSIGISAGLALAAALEELPFACGLATASALEQDVDREPLVAVEGRLAVARPQPSPSLLERYRVDQP